MKKVIHILSILLVLLVLVQLSQMFMPYWNLTPIKDRLNKDPQPTDYSIMQYCWTETRVMEKIFDDFFNKNFGKDTYVGNDYVVDLALISVFSVLTAALSIITTINDLSKKKSPVIKILAHVFAIWWAVLTFTTFSNSYLLTLGSYPMVWTIIFYASIPAIVVAIVRAVLALVTFVVDYRKAYHTA